MRSSVVLFAFLFTGTAAAAQNARATHIPAPVLLGKWALLGGAVAFNVAALHQHRAADDIFSQLTDRCDTDHALCATDAAGHYSDAASEALYQSTLRADGRARTWLVAGETALLGSVAMFVWELSRPRGAPKNIPFTPRVGVLHGRTALGLQVAF